MGGRPLHLPSGGMASHPPDDLGVPVPHGGLDRSRCVGSNQSSGRL